MEKMVHVWQIRCSDCGQEFEHIFRARDILRPHMLTSLVFKCPSCGKNSFDPVKPMGKFTLQQWQSEHPDLDINNLPDYSYIEEE